MQSNHIKQEVFKAKNATFYTTPENIGRLFGYCYQIVTTNQSSINATAVLQASIDGVTYDDVASSSYSITANGNYMWNVTNAFYVFARLKITITVGSADFLVNSSSKGA
jgi:hypothetical protein